MTGSVGGVSVARQLGVIRGVPAARPTPGPASCPASSATLSMHIPYGLGVCRLNQPTTRAPLPSSGRAPAHFTGAWCTHGRPQLTATAAPETSRAGLIATHTLPYSTTAGHPARLLSIKIIIRVHECEIGGREPYYTCQSGCPR